MHHSVLNYKIYFDSRAKQCIPQFGIWKNGSRRLASLVGTAILCFGAKMSANLAMHRAPARLIHMTFWPV
jgi:hypothetical protein